MRALRIIGIIFGCFIAAIIIAVVAIRLIVDPNDYKGRIEAAVKASTGRELSLPGKITLSVFPWVAVGFGPASLGNPPGFGSGPFASVQHASLRVRLFPLLHKQLQVGRIEIDGLDLRLLKNAQGRGNWQMSGSGTTSGSSASSGSASLQGIAGVEVKNSRVSYQGMVADHIDVDIGQVAQGAHVPIKWSLDLTTGSGARPIPIAGNATLTYGANSARIGGLDARIDASTLRGAAAVTNLATAATTFDLALDHIDFDRYLGARTSREETAATPASSASKQPLVLPTQLLKGLQTDGKLSIGSATLDGVKLTQVRVGVVANGGVLHIMPAAAQLYGGEYAGDVLLDARPAVPMLHLVQSMKGIDVRALLQDFARTDRLSGRGNLTMNLTAHGNTTDELTRTLSGHVAADLANGAVNGLDLWSAIDSAVALAERRTPPAGSSGRSTKFEVFKASADLTNGVASTKDLDVASGDLHVTGHGTANLVSGAIDYRVNATILKGAAAAGRQGGGALANIPLLVTGTLTSPTVRPDAQALAQSLARRALEQHKGEIRRKVQSVLEGLFH